MSPLEKKIGDQIEYYFGDHNLPRDKFLKEQIQLDDGWVPLETMIKFNRLSCLTTDFKVILEALSKSQTGLLEISEDKTKIRRSPSKPLPEINDQYKDVIKHRSVYVKGFPTDITLDELKEWFNDKGNVENIQMRRTLQRQFKGSVFVVFDTDVSAKKFVAQKDLKYKDAEMIVLLKEDYFTKKNEDRKHHRAEVKAKAKHEKEEKQKQAEDEEMKSLDEQTGCLLKFSGELEDQTSREDLQELFSGHGMIKWIDFTRGAKEGTILFKSNAKEALDKAKAAHGDNLQIKKKDVTWELLEGDDEKETLKKIIEDQQQSLNRKRGRVQLWLISFPTSNTEGNAPQNSTDKVFKAFLGDRNRKFGGRGGRRERGGRDQGKLQYQGKKTTFESEDECDPETASAEKKVKDEEAEAPVSQPKTGQI
ncbi:Lupus La protein-like [Acipenser ruthenus]|uniref:Lupus La protein-like n=1 Tax=Acipenser ruthenus TaxID=7906 RepID=A0A444TYY6_ACIRT|nr:Lupus La protein-like [Acipenser ruthenus]